MTLFVAERSIALPRMLSSLCQQALSFIDGGMQWLDWAIRTPLHRYQFDDESQLLDAIQQGLHDTPMAWLPQIGLQVSPVKLFSLGSDGLAALAAAEAGDTRQVLALQVQHVLVDNGLVTTAQLGAASALPGELGVADAPLLQGLGFDERLALFQLVATPPTAAQPAVTPQEAASFAVAQAQHPLEFCDYYRFYMQSAAGGETADARQQNTTVALQSLLPTLFGALDGIPIATLPSPQQVAQALASYMAGGRQIGFPRISLALQQTAAQSRTPGVELAVSPDASEAYLAAAQRFLASHPPRNGRLGQDGRSVQFQLEGDGRQAQLALHNGVLSLAAFGTQDTATANTPPAPTGAPP